MNGPPIPLTVLTVEQKNMLADETNPTIFGGGDEGPKPKPGMSPRSRTPQKPYLPKANNIITVLRNQIHQDQHRRLSRICLPILVIWLLLASFFSGILFYKHFSRQPTYFGWCGAKFVENGRQERLTQRLEIDPEELYERIQVPRFGANRPAVFVHDFRMNITAIVDLLGKRCFIKPLDRNLVAPPKSFIDLVEKLERGYYEQNPRVIHETYRVGAHLNMDELLGLESPMVARQCLSYDVFALEPASRSFESAHYFVRSKRRATDEALQFSVMNGESVEVEKIIF
ncbi:hypothetical protein QR680_017308 [Steinernema hermaphroditum]|uniref:Integral membrane protein 2 n=1 Tax=Steinernema hermaphroditum TaxID=289476 RepID=A0AA39HGH2_9BILA|nr:hypothetical protein QR680_017308 [Steinernema hermaphroditum]